MVPNILDNTFECLKIGLNKDPSFLVGFLEKQSSQLKVVLGINNITSCISDTQQNELK